MINMISRFTLPLPSFEAWKLNLSVSYLPRVSSEIKDPEFHSEFYTLGPEKLTLLSKAFSGEDIHTISTFFNHTSASTSKRDSNTSYTIKSRFGDLCIREIEKVDILHSVVGLPKSSYEPEICLTLSQSRLSRNNAVSSESSLATAKVLLNLPPHIPEKKGSFFSLNHISCGRDSGMYIVSPLKTQDKMGTRAMARLDLYEAGGSLVENIEVCLSSMRAYAIDTQHMSSFISHYTIRIDLKAIAFMLVASENSIALEHTLSPHYYRSHA